MPLKTPKNAKNTLAKFIRGYKLAHEDDFSDATARTFGYLFKCLAEYFRIDQDGRIEALEKFAEQGGFERAKREIKKSGK